MKKPLILFVSALGFLASRAVAQTTTTPPPATESKDNVWLHFDHPVPPPPPPGTDLSPAMQGPTYVPLDQDTYRLIDRYVIKYGPDTLHDPYTAVRPYHRKAIARLGQRILQDSSTAASLSAADRFNAEYLLRDNWNYLPQSQYVPLNRSRRPFLKSFYQYQTDLYNVKTEDFTLRVNPVLLLQVGKDTETNGIQYVNTRGVQLEGSIDGRLGFYTFLADNQMVAPQYVQTRIQRDQIVPHEGYWKYFKTEGSNQYDFFTARGGITYAAGKHVNLQLAHDRNFIGNGYRSLILSDYSAPYFFLKVNTRIWKFNYQNLFAELTAQREVADQVYPKKYMALHHLSFDVTPNFNIGVFESTILGGRNPEPDTVYANGKVIPGRRARGFELQYLNPVIFYRAVEQNVGSADNAILGLDFKWNILHRGQIYGQLVLDEFKISEIRAGSGWWANKQAFQIGGKYIDVAGIKNLDVQAEFNYIRPYTYQHEEIYTNYQHYQQPLAHPMGANLYELLGVLSYQPLPRLNVVGKAFYTKQGLDNVPGVDPEPNYGGNVLKSYNTQRVRDFGNTVGQGNTTKLVHLDLTASYMVKHNLWLDAKQIVRRQSGAATAVGNGTEAFTSVALRWNIAQRLHEF
ncbi:capsule assembly Wzi family protein [Hymenobacter cellulosivorans]|uniref:Capsule assembly Wzi family protein n=1 Tax=Hymenobacter cellulosivorans TaxID=2932249 RepID=A0ABY4FD69_9BACT|nr:capsule assembly Wzi family protein [Hymenobacter cellulosivorans]UOQ54625.1 capsule assembly Wzi family protein [Hymenobacter cellulosivorans]